MTVVNNSAPRTHPNDKLRYIPKSGMSRDHTRTGSRRSRCLGGVAEVRPCETGWRVRSSSFQDGPLDAVISSTLLQTPNVLRKLCVRRVVVEVE